MLKRIHTGFVSAVELENAFSEHLYNGVDTELNINGAVTPVNFKHTVPADEVHFLYQVDIHLLDGTVNLDKFGGIDTLSNGVDIGFYNSDDEVIFDPTDGHDIVMLSDFSILAGVFVEKVAGNVDDVFAVSWLLPSNFGGPLRMNPGD